MRVSVVVAVFNTGAYINGLLDSLEAQTLDQDEFEVVFVDDGSTDDTPALLDAVVARTSNFRVIHTPNSGWPGRPRNIGLDAAQGDYVFISDHDDRLDPEALQRLTDFASEHGSDVVIGKIIGVNRSAPERIFARTVVDAQDDPGLIMTSLTPQKLYRRAFLNEQGIRFPEGRRRLEDHLFVTRTYLRAKRVSIYADHPIYYFALRDDGQNASRRPIEWRGYYDNVAESIAVVDAEAADDEVRFIMRSRWLRSEAIGRLRGRRFVERHDRQELLESVHGLLRKHFTRAEFDRLDTSERLIGHLLLDDRLDDVVAFARWEASTRLDVSVTAALLNPASERLEVALTAKPVPATPLPASFETLPSGYPTRDDVERVRRSVQGAKLVVRLRRKGVEPLDFICEEDVRDGVLDVRATMPLRIPRTAEAGNWRLRVVARGFGPRLIIDPQVNAEGRSVLKRTAVRVGDRSFALAVGTRGLLVVTIDRIGIAAAMGRATRKATAAVRRVGRAARRRVPTRA